MPIARDKCHVQPLFFCFHILNDILQFALRSLK